MAVKLRLKRMGFKKQPFYRIVVADSHCGRDGRFIELLGTYNPIKGADKVTIDEKKTLDWLQKGAEPTDTVKNILSREGIMKKYAESKQKKNK